MMRRFKLTAVSVFLPFALAAMSAPADERYVSTRIDDVGQLHIVTDSGRQILPPRMKDQVDFSEVRISKDHRTVGWFVDYDDSGALGFNYSPLPGILVLYRNGRVLHRFTTSQVLWAWQFVDAGRRVAYTEGPLHGNPSGCVLLDVESGKVLARWFFKEDRAAPIWAQGIRCG